MKTLSMKHLLRGLAACALLCCTALAGAAQPAPALPGDSIYQLPLPLTDSHGKTAVAVDRFYSSVFSAAGRAFLSALT